MDQRKYPSKKEDELSEVTKAAIRERLAEGRDDAYQIATEFACSPSQVAGIKAAMTRGGKGPKPPLRGNQWPTATA